MCRIMFAALTSISLTGAALAQQVPGRDLFEFPIGLLAEAAPLSTQMTAGLWNPAAASLAAPLHAAFGFAGLTTPQEQGVRLDMIGGAYNIRPAFTASLSIASASVADILKTDTDPQSLGGTFEIPYGTTLLSAGAATSRKNVTVGLAARYRWGVSDNEHKGVFALDGGAIVDRVAGTPLRVAFSTFMFRPLKWSDETSYMAAADVPVLSRDSTLTLRGGYSIATTDRRGREGYAFATARYHLVDFSTGFARTNAFGNVSWQWRLGCGLQYAGYTVAVGRDDGAAGLGASYQFLLKRVIQ